MSIDQGTISNLAYREHSIVLMARLASLGQNAKNTARSIQESFNGIDLHESRGSLMLIDEMLGVHLPRHATAFAATLPGIQDRSRSSVPAGCCCSDWMGIFDGDREAKRSNREELEKQKKELEDATEALTKHTASLEQIVSSWQINIAVLEGRQRRTKSKRLWSRPKAAAVNLNKELGDSNCQDH